MRSLVMRFLLSFRAFLSRFVSWMVSCALFSRQNFAQPFLWGGTLFNLGLTAGSSLTQLKTSNGDAFMVNSTYHTRVKSNFLHEVGEGKVFLTGLEATFDYCGLSRGSTVSVAQSAIYTYSVVLLEQFRTSSFNFDFFGGYGTRMLIGINTAHTAMSVSTVGAIQYGGTVHWKILASQKGASGLFVGVTQTNANKDLLSGTGANFGSFFYTGSSKQFQFKPYFELNSYSTKTGTQTQAIYGLHLGFELPTIRRHIQYDSLGR